MNRQKCRGRSGRYNALECRRGPVAASALVPRPMRIINNRSVPLAPSALRALHLCHKHHSPLIYSQYLLMTVLMRAPRSANTSGCEFDLRSIMLLVKFLNCYTARLPRLSPQSLVPAVTMHHNGVAADYN